MAKMTIDVSIHRKWWALPVLKATYLFYRIFRGQGIPDPVINFIVDKGFRVDIH